MNKFWEWMNKKNYPIQEYGVNSIAYCNQMLIGYLYEYIHFLLKGIFKKKKYKYVDEINIGISINYAWNHKNHYQELCNIIKVLEEINE